MSDQQKADLKLPNALRVPFSNLNSISRNFSTSPFWIPSRTMSNNRKSSSHDYDHRGHCDKEDRKIQCDPARKSLTGCPRFVLNECAQSKGSDCVHQYVDVSFQYFY